MRCRDQVKDDHHTGKSYRTIFRAEIILHFLRHDTMAINNFTVLFIPLSYCEQTPVFPVNGYDNGIHKIIVN